jgi:hypothetical protein
MLLVRVDSERSMALLESVTAVAKAIEMEPPTRIADPVRLAVTSLLQGSLKTRQTESNTERVDASFLPALSENRAMVAAVSVRGNESLLDTLSYATPTSPSMLPYGLSARVYLPAQDPTELLRQIEAYCAEDDSSCPALRRTAQTDSFAVIDVHFDPLGPAREKYAPESTPEVEWAAADPGFWKRDTPALRAFTEDDAAVSVYWRTDDLPQLGAYAGAAEVLEALAYAAPDARTALQVRGYSIAGMTYLFRSPEARENEDISFSIDADEAGGFVASVNQTYTRHGAEVAQAATTSMSLPAIELDGAVIEFESSHDVAAALSAAKIPLWMQPPVGQGGPRALAELLRNSGVWGYMIPTMSYPVGFQKGLVSSGTGHAGGVMSQFKDIVAVRAKIDLVGSESSRLGFAPRGAIALAFDRNSSAPAMVGSAVQSLKGQYGLHVTTNTQTTNEHMVMTIVFGHPDGMLGESTPVAENVRVDVDLERIAARFELDALREEDMQVPPEVISALRHLKSARLERLKTDKGAVTRLHVGASKLDAPAVPSAEMNLVEPVSDESECLRRAVSESREALAAEPKVAPNMRINLRLDVLARLEEIQESCESDSERLGWMQAAWLAHIAEAYAERLNYEEAAKSMSKSCAMGFEAACERTETIKAHAAKRRYPAVDRPMVELSEPPQDTRILTVDGLERGSRSTLDAGEEGPVLSVAQLEKAARDSSPDKRPTQNEQLPFLITDEIDGTTAGVVFLPVDRRVSSEVIESIVLMAQNQRIDKRLIRQRQLLNESVPASRSYAGVVFPVDAERTKKAQSIAGIYLTTGGVTSKTPAKVVIGANGISLEFRGKTAKLAAEDAETLAKLVEKAMDEGDSATFAELNKAYRVGVVGEALAKLNAGMPEAVDIVIREPVPFGLLAGVIAELGETLEKDGAGAVPQIRLVVGDE